jgi:hypothetical protein
MDKSESEIQGDIVEFLRSINVTHSVTNASGNMGSWKKCRGFKTRKGWPDIVGCLPNGRFLAIEVKAKTGQVSPDQEEIHEEIRRSKGAVIVARCVRDVAEDPAVRGRW